MLNLVPSELSFVLCAWAAGLSVLWFCAAVPAQDGADPEAIALVARIEAARGTPGKLPESLLIEGTYVVTFEGAGAEPVASGKFREVFAGSSLARHTSDMGEHGLMERGITPDLAWEVDPVLGAGVHAEAQARSVRRYFAVLRGATPRALYQDFARRGLIELAGREHVHLAMTTAEGKIDGWYVDPENGRVTRIDLALPVPESADVTFGTGQEIDTQVTFDDWRAVGGIQYPHRRTLKMGAATVAFTCTRIEAGTAIDPAEFAPPAAVVKIQDRQPAEGADGGSKPPYQVVEREAQPVASIRLKCKPSEISATLAVVLPEVMAHLTATGTKMAGPPFSRYHAFGADEIDLEAGIPVAKAFAEKGRVKNRELPAGPALMAWHAGPYEQLAEAHQALQAHLVANKLTAAGGPWEIYWTDPGMVPDPAKWRTQIFMPLAK